MRRARGPSGSAGRRPGLVGTLIIAALAGVVYVSYTAQNGLPLQSTYRISVDVPDAAEMTKNSDVRIGGARVGQVLTISAEPAHGGHPPFARLGIALTDSGARHLPVDTRTKIRLASLLGGKYLELTPGRSSSTVPDGGVLPLADNLPIVDLDEAFRAFGGRTAVSLRQVIGGLGDALAGRGTAINTALGSTRSLLPPLQRVLGTLIDPRTGLAGFVRGAASAAGALAPLADGINALVDHSATTLQALERARGSLGATLEQLPPTEKVATATLHRLRPVLADAAAVAQGLQPGARLLPTAAQRLDAVLLDTTPVLLRVPRLSAPLTATFAAVDRFARDPRSVTAIAALHDVDLPTFSTSLLVGLGGVLRYAAGAQLHCNVIGLWARNLSSTLSDGDAAGAWLSTAGIASFSQGQQVAEPSPDLHFDPYPREDATACQAGNERYLPGQAIGRPAATDGTGVDETSPPPGVLERYPGAGFGPGARAKP